MSADDGVREGERPRGHRRARWLIPVGAALLLLCVGLGVLGVRAFRDGQAEADAGLAVLDQFMQAGARRDDGAAWALFAERAGAAEVTRADLAALFRGRREVFDGYRAVQTVTWQMLTGTMGTSMTLVGRASYGAGPERLVTATLVDEGSRWRLLRVRFTDGVG